ncbi:SDR family NAD(P)-dependent oxidoreductase [Bradyrhizobium sp. Arg237L]|uniref:SDR family NAD(P)-dependent oxidoreductase n=1 Tax=Bradyrhizobium sp. Arg237L TaxID=3003352 RepID=UPI00249EF613|nr:SDR family NAD(P)-dependent oxidoreductase [Bradyrhizobium sp. Arg237L]MDI4238596.1 SDR family NAD(P)-dependent oxidoreductase [Bradyrhizobium sp. Arg237L]
MRSASLRIGRSVVITSAGAGLGRDIALALAARGYIVFGTAESAAEARDLKNASGGRVSLTVCDVTKTTSVEAWACGVTDALGNAGLDLLINNASILTQGPIETLQLDDIRHEFDCNVFAVISVTNAFLPALRAARGRIVQISSWMASLPLPFSGPSEAAHAAMEVFAAVYRAELKPFGIDVVVVSIGNMSMGAGAASGALARIGNAMTAEQRRLYGKTFGAFASRSGSVQADEIDPAAAAARVVELAEQRPAPSRAAIGRDTEQMLSAVRQKPDAELDALRLRLAGLS